MPEDRRSWLRKLLDQPRARDRVRKAVASLLAVGVVTIGALGALLIWHLVRRGRLIREGLRPPRPVDLSGFELDSGPAAGPPHEPDRDPGGPR